VLSDRRPNSQLSDIDEHLALYGSEAYGRVPPSQLGMIFPWRAARLASSRPK